MRKYYVFILLFLYCFVFSQDVKRIDENIDQAKSLINSGRRTEAMVLLDNVIQFSNEINYAKGTILGCYGKGYVYYVNQDFQNSLKYLQLALTQDLSKISFSEQVKIYHLFGQIYTLLELNEDATVYYKKMLRATELIPDKKEAMYRKSIAYNDLATISWRNKDDKDSAYYYMSKIYKDLSVFSPRDDKLNTILTKATTGMGIINSLRRKKDSSDYYLKKASTFIPKNVADIPRNVLLNKHLSYIYAANKEYDKAKENNNLFIKKSEKSGTLEDLGLGYKIKQKISEKRNDTIEAYKSLKKYVQINDSLQNYDHKNLRKSYLTIIHDKNEDLRDKTKNSRHLAVIIIIMLLLLGYGGYYFKKYIKKRNKEKENILSEKQSEISELESKVNIAFDEVIELAKKNSPEFITRFQEVYPEFCKEIFSLQPDMKKSELIFCAYLLLGFSTKDIVNYTFVSPETVKMRRYRLRKKFNIPSDKDLNLWMKDLDESSHKKVMSKMN